jgi:hypothetical protein
VVTKFTLKTYPIKKFWTGMRIMRCTREEYHEGLQDFVIGQNEFPKVATLMTLGSQVMAWPGKNKVRTKSLFNYPGGLNTSSRSYEEDFKDNVPAQIDYLMKALGGASYVNMDLVPAEVQTKLNLQETAAAGAPGYYAMAMIYDGEVVPKGAWGKKFESIPAIGTYGAPVEYAQLVSPSF